MGGIRFFLSGTIFTRGAAAVARFKWVQIQVRNAYARVFSMGKKVEKRPETVSFRRGYL